MSLLSFGMTCHPNPNPSPLRDKRGTGGRCMGASGEEPLTISLSGKKQWRKAACSKSYQHQECEAHQSWCLLICAEVD
jgi:hypothetical protein